MPILHRDNWYILVGRILLFVWDAHFYVGMSKLIVKTGKYRCLHGMPIFTAGCPYLLWNWAPGCLYIFTWILASRCLFLREIWHPGCLFLGVPIFTWHRCHVRLGTPIFRHPGWLISQENLKFWSPGWPFYREIGNPGLLIYMGKWGPPHKNGHPLQIFYSMHVLKT